MAKSSNNVTNLVIAEDTNNSSKPASQEGKMDVTALMDLLGKKRKAPAANDFIPDDSDKKIEKGSITDTQEALQQSNTHVPESRNESLFAPSPLRYIVLSAIISALVIGVLSALYVIENKADDWFVHGSNKQYNKALSDIAPAAGGTDMEQRLGIDRNLAESSNILESRKQLKIIPIDNQELIDLLSKPYSKEE